MSGDVARSSGSKAYNDVNRPRRIALSAIGTVSNVASRLCDEAKPGQILISPRVLTKVENVVTVEPVGEFVLKRIRRSLVAYNVLEASPSKLN